MAKNQISEIELSGAKIYSSKLRLFGGEKVTKSENAIIHEYFDRFSPLPYCALKRRVIFFPGSNYGVILIIYSAYHLKWTPTPHTVRGAGVHFKWYAL